MAVDSRLPSPDVLRQLLRYEPKTGELFWKKRPLEYFKKEGDCNAWNTRYSDTPAFTSNRSGYKVGLLFRRSASAHRVIWAMWYGFWPDGEIDHIDGNRANNRIENLRSVSTSVNQRNAKRPITNTSGVLGVSWHKRDRKWQVLIKVDGSRRCIGYFDNIDDAALARKEADRKFGYHPNHGR